MNVKLKRLVSLALTMSVMGGMAPLTHAEGPLNNYQLTNIVIYMKDPKKLKQFSLVNKKTRRVAQTPKINPCPVRTAKCDAVSKVITSYDKIFDICGNIETICPKSFEDFSYVDICYLASFNFDLLYGRKKGVKIVEFKPGTFKADHLLSCLKYDRGFFDEVRKDCKVKVEKPDTTPHFKLIFEYKEKKIIFDIMYGCLGRSIGYFCHNYYDYEAQNYNAIIDRLFGIKVVESLYGKARERVKTEKSCLEKDDPIRKKLVPISLRDSKSSVDADKKTSGISCIRYSTGIVGSKCDCAETTTAAPSQYAVINGDVPSLTTPNIFKALPNAKSIFVPSKVSCIGKNVFKGSKFEEIAISKGTTPIEIHKGAFYGAGKELKLIYIPDNAILDPGMFSDPDYESNDYDPAKYREDLVICYGKDKYSLADFKQKVLATKKPI